MKWAVESVAALLGGGVGACSRLWLATAVEWLCPPNFPWGIFVVNVTGSFLIGLLIAILTPTHAVSVFWRTFLFIGVLGGFTTFSSFSLDTLALVRSGSVGVAFIYVFSTVGLCLLATWCGWLLAQ